MTTTIIIRRASSCVVVVAMLPTWNGDDVARSLTCQVVFSICRPLLLFVRQRGGPCFSYEQRSWKGSHAAAHLE
jgi:hypothetical protein